MKIGITRAGREIQGQSKRVRDTPTTNDDDIARHCGPNTLEGAYLRMRTTGVLSLTPHFSGVLTAKRNSITVSTVSPPPTKPLKRFNSATVHLAPH
jgi:hypothetical protein